jgi:hypothetical protein
MDWVRRKARDTQVMFAVRYEDGRSAYIRVPPKRLENGDRVVAEIARDRQEQGEIPGGTIVGIKRVR